jgi:hypothetical protein
MLHEKMMCMKVDDRARHDAKMLDQLCQTASFSPRPAASESDTNEIRKVPWPERHGKLRFGFVRLSTWPKQGMIVNLPAATFVATTSAAPGAELAECREALKMPR